MSAADVEELSVASQKAASAAVTTGVNMDQLAAQIATIETVTREAPENIGNGLKTLYARFSDIKMGETLEDGVDLGKVTSTLEKVGVQVINADGNMREVGNIMEDLMDVWGQLDLTQRNAIGQTLAGKFQYTRFSALMNRSDLYKDYLAASEGETGTATMDMMQEVFEESMQGRLNKLRSAVEGIFTNAFNTDDFYAMIDAVTKLVEVFDDLIQSIGGGKNALMGFGAIATKVFSNQIAQGVGNFIQNRQTNELAKSNIDFAINDAKNRVRGAGVLNTDSVFMNEMDANIAQAQQYIGTMSQEQLDNFTQDARDYSQAATEATIAQKEFNENLNAGETIIKAAGVTLGKNTSINERYQEVKRKFNEAQADGVPYIAQEDEMYQALEHDLQKLANTVVQLADEVGRGLITEENITEANEKWKTSATQLGQVIDELTASEMFNKEQTEQLATIKAHLTRIVNGEYKSLQELEAALAEDGMTLQSFARYTKEAGLAGENFIKNLERSKSAMESTAAQTEVLGKKITG